MGVDSDAPGWLLMTVVHRFTLPIPPSVRDAWRPAKGRGLVPSREVLEYRATVAQILSGRLPIHGPVVCELTVYFARDSGDLSNRLKVLEDALEGFAYHDDKQIRGYSRLWREVDPANPRVVLRVEGERFATREEARAHRDAKAAANQKRKVTLHRNRAAKNLAKMQLKPAVTRPR